MRFTMRRTPRGFDPSIDPNAQPPGAGLEEQKEREISKARRRALRREEIRHEFETGEPDPHRYLRRAVVNEPMLLDRLNEAIDAGLPAETLADVPAYRRAAHVEALLESWASGRSADPCDICGSYSLRAPRYSDHAEIGKPRPVQPHVARKVEVDRGSTKPLLLCAVCSEAVSGYTDGLLAYGAHVLSAFCGYRGSSPNRRVFYAFERPGKGNGTPWSHVDSAAIVGAARDLVREGRWLPRGFVTTAAQARLLVEPFGPASGIVARRWDPKNLPTQHHTPAASVSYLATLDEKEVKRRAEDAERSRVSAEHTAAYRAEEAAGIARLDKFKSKHPVPKTGYTDERLIDQWDAIVEDNRNRLWNIDKSFGVTRPIYSRANTR